MAYPERIEHFKNSPILDSIRDVLENADLNIQKEVLKHNIHWLGAFKSRITEVMGYIELAEGLELSPDEVVEATAKLENLTEKVEQLRSEFEPENRLLPAEIQRELLHELDVLPHAGVL